MAIAQPYPFATNFAVAFHGLSTLTIFQLKTRIVFQTRNPATASRSTVFKSNWQ